MTGDVGDVLLELAVGFGVREARGVTGGPITRILHRLEDSCDVRWAMCRTEGGAVFQAVGVATTTGRPVLIMTTSGPGMLGARQALEVAKRERVHLLMVSPRTPAAQRGRHVPQGSEEFLSADFLLPGLFDLVTVLESADELAPLAAVLGAGLARSEGFLAHVVIPSDLIDKPAVRPLLPDRRRAVLTPDPTTCSEIACLLGTDPFFVLAGAGARPHHRLVRSLLDATGAPAIATPAGRGVVNERSAAFFGGSGIGGHAEAIKRLRAYRPSYALVLGSGLSGASASQELVSLPSKGLIHIDRDARAMGAAWQVPTLAVEADLGAALDGILACSDVLVRRPLPPGRSPVPADPPDGHGPAGLVRPRFLMHAVQELVVDATSAPLFVDVGSFWPWSTSCLAIPSPERWSLEVGVGCMGRGIPAAVGGAIATRAKTVALVGDWSADMGWPELRSAVDRDAPVVVIVCDSNGGQMVIDGDMENWGRPGSSARFRSGDMAAAARAVGARGRLVDSEAELAGALAEAMAADGPFLLDVKTDGSAPAPYGPRFGQLRPGGSR